MAQAKKIDFDDSAHLLDEEDEATLTILKQRSQSSEEAKLVSAEDVRQRIQW